MPDEHITTLLAELQRMGEDPEELGYWRSLLPDMTDEQKAELAASLEAEAIGLKKAAGVAVSPEEEQRLTADTALLEQAKHRDQAQSDAARHDAAEQEVARIKENL